jgi:hypothetical protein
MRKEGKAPTNSKKKKKLLKNSVDHHEVIEKGVLLSSPASFERIVGFGKEINSVTMDGPRLEVWRLGTVCRPILAV